MITSGKKRLRYVVWAPSVYPSETELWPVPCFLHGNSEAEPLDVRQAATRHGPLKSESAQKAADQFVIVFPQLPALGGDVWQSYAGEVRAIVEAVQTRFNGNPRQTYLTGFSYGADGVLDITPDHKGFWSAIWAVDPTREHTCHPGCPVWLSSGPAAQRVQPGLNKALRLRPATINRNSDLVFEDSGVGHVDTATSAYRDSRVYDWLLARHL